jgi:AcrR family transcriptional regulator
MNTSSDRRVEPAGDRDVKSEIVEAAIRLFATRGYRRTTIAAIAREVGLTDAGVLYHFPTKAELFSAVVDYYGSLQLERFNELIAPGGLQAFQNLAEWGTVMEERPDLVGLQVLLSAEAVSGEDEIHRYFAQRYDALRSVLASVLDEAIRNGEVDPSVDAEFEATSLMTFLDGIRLQWLYAPDRVSITRSLKAYVDRAVAGMRVRSP